VTVHGAKFLIDLSCTGPFSMDLSKDIRQGHRAKNPQIAVSKPRQLQFAAPFLGVKHQDGKAGGVPARAMTASSSRSYP
jgi:hypothetical protein